MGYIGRFAPSPTGRLHAGSLVAALASWLDAKANRGLWLVRIEDVDTTRCKEAWGYDILQQLSSLWLHHDRMIVWQSSRTNLYQNALERLISQNLCYRCICSRKAILHALGMNQNKTRNIELIYPGTCRSTNHQIPHSTWRLQTNSAKFSSVSSWIDRNLGLQNQDVEKTVGDFILKRSDECFSYQLAVVVDDSAQNVSCVVRGQDLIDNTGRQILIQKMLGLPALNYLHTPLVLTPQGEKLSKQSGAPELDTTKPLERLQEAAITLGLTRIDTRIPTQEALQFWVNEWAFLYNLKL